MNKQTLFVFRVLAILTGFQAILGVVLVGIESLDGRRLLQQLALNSPQNGNLRTAYLFFLVASGIFTLLLGASATLLWRMRKIGIWLLAATLLLELAYVISVASITCVILAT